MSKTQKAKQSKAKQTQREGAMLAVKFDCTDIKIDTIKYHSSMQLIVKYVSKYFNDNNIAIDNYYMNINIKRNAFDEIDLMNTSSKIKICNFYCKKNNRVEILLNSKNCIKTTDITESMIANALVKLQEVKNIKL